MLLLIVGYALDRRIGWEQKVEGGWRVYDMNLSWTISIKYILNCDYTDCGPYFEVGWSSVLYELLHPQLQLLQSRIIF